MFGLGGNKAITDLTVAWPDGSCERWSGLAVNQYHQLDQGMGDVANEDCGGDS